MSTPGGHGSTTVSDRALVKIAEQIAAEDDRLADRPHASASVSGSIATVHLDLAVRYPSPAPVPRLAAELRARLRHRLRELTGLSAENIDIEIVRLPGAAAGMPAPRHPPGPAPDREGRYTEGRYAEDQEHAAIETRRWAEGGAPAATPSTGAGHHGGRFMPARDPAYRSGRRAFRPTRAVPATVTALVLLAVGVLTAVHVVSALFGRPIRLVPYETVLAWARATTWNGGGALAAASVLMLLGALLLLLSAVPGRGHLLALRTADPDLVVGMSRHALARRLRHVAGAVDGVRRARVRVSGRRAKVRAWTDLRDATAVTGRVRAAVDQELARLSPVHRMSVGVRVSGPS
ncbi:DUF6286 domain-containing protein [Sphaerimonospora sp. CA-214678]|uniref:DUF6286 domain-containing protein n=1 Tax=Sphaerimonospora sp. CA-214678 TaxID=3240029 RepID=UPI003D8CCA78